MIQNNLIHTIYGLYIYNINIIIIHRAGGFLDV